MPIITVNTNISRGKIPKEIHSQLTDIGAKFLKKPREVIWVQVYGDCSLTQNATFDPTAVVSVECIGRLKPSLNLAMARQIEDYLGSQMAIPRDRIVIRFQSVPAQFCTYNGALHDMRIQYDEDLES